MIKVRSKTAEVNYIENVQDTWVLAFALKDGEGNLLDLTGSIVEIVVKTTPATLDSAALLQYTSLTDSNIIINYSATENIHIEISDSDTETLGDGKFFYSVRITYTNGYVNTVAKGYLFLEDR